MNGSHSNPGDFQNGHAAVNNGNAFDNNGNAFENNGNAFENNGNAFDNNGNAFDNNGNAVDNNGNAFGYNGNAVDNNGNAVDNNGNAFGYISNVLRAKLEELGLARETYGTIDSGPFLELKNGKKMPALAVGTALIDEEEVGAVVKAAIDIGYRHIDAAMVYGNEEQIGDAIEEKIGSGEVSRDDLFVTSKLWSNFHRRDLVMMACQETLYKLKTPYLDLYLIHNPVSLKQGTDMLPMVDGAVVTSEVTDYLDAWLGMEDLVKAGLVRSIGVANFNSEQLKHIAKIATIMPVVNQVECNPYLAQIRLSEYCKSKGITLGCFGALGSIGTPEAYLTVGKKKVLQDPAVKKLAEKYGKTAAQILLRYQLDRGHYAVVKTTSAARLFENLGATTFQLSTDDVQELNNLDCDQRQFTFIGFGETHKNYPFNIPF